MNLRFGVFRFGLGFGTKGAEHEPNQTVASLVPTIVYSKPCAQGLGYAHVLLWVARSYLGPHMHAMFSCSRDSAISTPQQDKISWSYLNTDNN